MKLSLEEVEHVADLARLALTAEEKERFREQLSSILEYAERLQELDLSDVPPSAGAPTWGVSRPNVLRDDEVRPSMPQDDVLANAPWAQDGYFRVPIVLEGEE